MDNLDKLINDVVFKLYTKWHLHDFLPDFDRCYTKVKVGNPSSDLSNFEHEHNFVTFLNGLFWFSFKNKIE